MLGVPDGLQEVLIVLSLWLKVSRVWVGRRRVDLGVRIDKRVGFGVKVGLLVVEVVLMIAITVLRVDLGVGAAMLVAEVVELHGVCGGETCSKGLVCALVDEGVQL